MVVRSNSTLRTVWVSSIFPPASTLDGYAIQVFPPAKTEPVRKERGKGSELSTETSVMWLGYAEFCLEGLRAHCRTICHVTEGRQSFGWQNSELRVEPVRYPEFGLAWLRAQHGTLCYVTEVHWVSAGMAQSSVQNPQQWDWGMLSFGWHGSELSVDPSAM